MRAFPPIDGFRLQGAPGKGQHVPTIPRSGAPSVDPASHRLPARRIARGIPGSRRSGLALLRGLPLIVFGLLGLVPLLGELAASSAPAVQVMAPERVAIAFGARREPAAEENAQEFIGRIARRFLLAGLPGIVIRPDGDSRPRLVLVDASACGIEPAARPDVAPARIAVRPDLERATIVLDGHPSRAPPARSGFGE